MKTRLISLVTAALLSLCIPATADTSTLFGGSTDFESIDMSDSFFAGNVTDSSIATDASVATDIPAANRPANYSYAATRDKVLAVDAPEDAPLFRNLNADGSTPSNPSFIYADMLVKGTAHKSNDDIQPTSPDDKILVYFKETEENGGGVSTNLYVRAGAFAGELVDESDFLEGGYEYKLTTPGVASIDANTWYRIVIVSMPDCDGLGQGFQIYFGGFGPDYLCTGPGIRLDGGEGAYDSYNGKLDDVFLSLTTDENHLHGTMTSLGFTGSVSVDDFVVSTIDPDKIAVTLSWPTTLGSVSYAVGGVTNALTAADGTAIIAIDSGETVTLFGGFGDYVKEVSGSSGTLALRAAEINYFFPRTATADQDGTAEHPFEIATESDLYALQAAVANGYGADLSYVQVDDISLTAPWPGIGIPNGKDIYNTEEFQNGAFRGTYDGGNFTVSNFQMVGVAGNPASETEGLDYCGFFNSTYQATICNLKISYAGSLFAEDTTASTKESGATFVGVAKNSTLRNLTTLAGTVSCSKGFGGISGYTTSGTVIDSCTNNLNMTSLAGNKCGGIAMITQNGEAVTITNCQNTGTQTTGSANSEYGAIVGYVGLNTTIADCETTVGRFLKHQNNTVTLQGVNKGDATVASYHGAATPGLNFATVDGNVATFVADDALAAGNTYKVMGPSATATYQFTAPGSISFDEALFAPTYAITAPDLALTDATEGTVRTYTAAAAPSYKDPQGLEIGDPVLVGWLAGNGFTQEDINDLGSDAAATDKLYECWLLNCSITAQNPGGTIHTTGIAVTNGVVSITVQLVRQSPLGVISGVLHLYGTDDLADDFSLISEEIVGISEGDSTFATAETEGAVTQSVTATFSPTDVTATFFKAKIEFQSAGEPGEPPEEPDDPEGSEE